MPHWSSCEALRRMDGISQHRGIGVFGRAYGIMLANDCHADGSVDRVLMENMILLSTETVAYLYDEYTPIQVRYGSGSRPELECHVAKAAARYNSDEERVDGIVKFCSELGKEVAEDPDAIVVGGTEEEIIRRGSDWCSDVARVGCSLCQVAGFPARLVYLTDTRQAYSGHAIIEAHRNGFWGALDAITAVVYRYPNGQPASTWELKSHPQLIEVHRKSSDPYTKVEQFRNAAISNYFIWDREHYNYAVSPINDYYRSILKMANGGWPGGLRWLHGEDNGTHHLPT